MTRRKIVSAAFFFAVFGAVALLPPFVLLFRLDLRIFGIPIEITYIFVLWTILVLGARWFSRVLPLDEAPRSLRDADQ